METTMETIQDLFEEHRIPMYAIGDVRRMSHVRPGNRPGDMLPGARSMLCVAGPFPTGVNAARRSQEILYWWNSNLRWHGLDDLMLDVCRHIEETGYKALPIPGCFPLDINIKGEFCGYVSMIHMAEALEMGTIGKNGLIFHSRYGPRLTFGALVTDAPLPEMIVPGPDSGACPESCRYCVDNCPAGAIDENGHVDLLTCALHSAESPGRFLYLALFRGLIPVLARLKLVDTKRLLPKKLQRLANITFANTHGMFTCIDCVSRCPYPDGIKAASGALRSSAKTAMP